jgi:hypothetical protein
MALLLALGIWVFTVSSPTAYGGDRHGDEFESMGQKGHNHQGRLGYGSLRHGGPGLYPGYQGFGLSFHPGYGYGGHAVGTGDEGGYPYYGGPGYPHLMPQLRRFGKLTRLPYYGGPGYPTADHPNFYAGVGPLVVDQPVAFQFDRREPGYADGYGPFTGALPYPGTLFAPYATAAAISGSYREPGSPDPSMTALPARGRNLGIDEEPVVEASGVRGLKVSKVYPGTAAERAGLQAGDVIHSINGYLTQERGNLAWIIANATPNNLLTMKVRTKSDGEEHTITAQLPSDQTY